MHFRFHEWASAFLRFMLARHSDFFLNRMHVLPRYVRLKVTHTCNMRCKMCNHWREDLPSQPSLSELEKLAVELSDNGFEYIGLTGGEPLLRKDLEEVVETFSMKGFSVGMTTNGTLLDKERLMSLYNNGLHSVNISIDGPKEVHDEIRGKEAYENTIDGLGYAVNLSKRKDFHVTCNTVLCKTTVPHILDTIKENWRIGASTTIQPIMSSAFWSEAKGMWIDDFNALDSQVDRLIEYKQNNPVAITNPIYSLEFLKDYFRNPRVPKHPCTFGYMAIAIDANMDLYSCWSLPRLGNLREKDISDILGSDSFKNRQINMFKKKCPGCSCGYVIRLGTIGLKNAFQLIQSKEYIGQF